MRCVSDEVPAAAALSTVSERVKLFPKIPRTEMERIRDRDRMVRRFSMLIQLQGVCHS